MHKTDLSKRQKPSANRKLLIHRNIPEDAFLTHTVLANPLSVKCGEGV